MSQNFFKIRIFWCGTQFQLNISFGKLFENHQTSSFVETIETDKFMKLIKNDPTQYHWLVLTHVSFFLKKNTSDSIEPKMKTVCQQNISER